MKFGFISVLLCVAAVTFGASTYAESPLPKAQIIGVAGIAYDVTDLGKARDYYETYLGFAEVGTLKNADGTEHALFIKINDHQFIELILEPPTNHGFLHSAMFETNDAAGMRDELAAKGIKVPNKVSKNAAGNLSFDITDPSGFDLEIVQYLPGSLTGKTKGLDVPKTRISDHIDHIGLLVANREESWAFYASAFGFVKEGDGSKMVINGGADRFELGVDKKSPTVDRFHIKDHLCLSNQDVPKMTAMLEAKPIFASEFPKSIPDTHQLANGKNVAEIYDLDGNRIEVMEPPKQGDPASANAKKSGS
jgi:catechol 2,3-dioxygenase-like lactoylglutathione lyase family enzyme